MKQNLTPHEAMMERQIARLRAREAVLVRKLTAITRLGGNLSDERLEAVGGPKEGRSRAIMYTSARAIAHEALATLDVEPEKS